MGELAAGRAPGEIRNLMYKTENKIVANPVRPYLSSAELDAIPFVSRFFSKQLDLLAIKRRPNFIRLWI